MQAMVIRQHGGPDVLEARQMPEPKPQPGEIVIRVKAIGVNFADLLQRMGVYPRAPKPPSIPGLEIAGVVEKVAEAARPDEGEKLRVGDAVCALTNFNGYAEWVSTPAKLVFPLPPGMPFDQGAALPVNYLTAFHSMFTMGNLQAGERMLVHGAAGGVGIAAVQMARARGVEIFGTAGPAKIEFLRKIGVSHAIDYTKTDFVSVVEKYAPEGIELVMDPVGGKSFAQSYKCLGPTGRLVIYGFSAAAGDSGKRNLFQGLKAILRTPRFHPLKLMGDNKSVIGVSLAALQDRGDILRREMAEILRMYSAGQVRPVIAKTFPLADAKAAHQYIQDRKNIGKVVLTVR